MTWYCVQISRYFKVEAEDEHAAEEAAFAMEYTAPSVAITNVTVAPNPADNSMRAELETAQSAGRLAGGSGGVPDSQATGNAAQSGNSGRNP